MQLHFSSCLIVPCLHSETCGEMIQKLYMVWFFLVWVPISFPHLTFFPPFRCTSCIPLFQHLFFVPFLSIFSAFLPLSLSNSSVDLKRK